MRGTNAFRGGSWTGCCPLTDSEDIKRRHWRKLES
jgi:hypothetical protein